MPRVQTKVIAPVGIVLSSLASSHGLTPAELGIKSSIDAGTWAEIVSGEATISQKEIEDVAEAVDKVRRERALKSSRSLESIRESLLRAAGYIA